MKKFSLEEYLAHQEKKVVRRDGKAARIVCTDFQRSNGVFDIIVCFFVDKERELAYSVNTEGRRYENEETKDDIFFADDEKQLTEFEKALEVFLMNADSSEETFHDEVKKHAAELLALARDQFIKDGYVIEKKAFHDAVEKVAPEAMKEVSDKVDMEEAIRLGYEKGRADALKDLPRWERLYSKENADKIHDCIIPGKALDNRLVHRGFELKITDLEKLPGFKEDEKWK